MSFINMGGYYTTKDYGLIKVVTEADYNGKRIVVFTKVQSGGMASDLIAIDREDFITKYGF